MITSEFCFMILFGKSGMIILEAYKGLSVSYLKYNYLCAHDILYHFTVVVGEVVNFAAYAFAPAILVTPCTRHRNVPLN